MCESRVFMSRGSAKELVMEDVARIVVEQNRVVCVDTLGERKEVPGATISEANLVRHEIILIPRGP